MRLLTEKVIGCAFAVSNTLGCGFLEKVYENALAHELRKAGLKAEQQYGIVRSVPVRAYETSDGTREERGEIASGDATTNMSLGENTNIEIRNSKQTRRTEIRRFKTARAQPAGFWVSCLGHLDLFRIFPASAGTSLALRRRGNFGIRALCHM